MNEKMLKEYARMAVYVGSNVQPGQTLIINCPIDGAVFGRMCAEAAYEKGAKEVVVHYSDEKLSRIKMEHTAKEVLCDVKPYRQNSYLEYIKSEGGAALLNIISRDPEIYKGLDTDKIDAANKANMEAMEEYRSYTMASRIQWSIVAIPSPSWAKKVFPELSEDEAVEKLWKTIFKVSRVEGDAIQNWVDFTTVQNKRRDHINSLNIRKLHLTSKNGTDLYIGLADDAVWCGANEENENGIEFVANMPTEEIFTCPHLNNVDGIVYGTKPYVYNGNLINDFMMKFEKGKVVDFDAKEGRELLEQLLNSDEGSRRIGEIALVPASSPINRENVLFYNTLFDENASCHIALGQGYPTTVVGGGKMNKEELIAKGVNSSIVHEDVMVGSEDMKIIGFTADDKEVDIFVDGEWVF